MSIAVVVAAVVAGAGSAAIATPDGPRGTAAAANLLVTAWPEGRGAQSRSWSLRCSPAGGTLPGRARACSRLGAMDTPFAPVPDGVACTQIFGGPQQALVRGTYRGRKVWARFNRSDGCEIARWNRHAFLFPISVGAAASR